MDFLSITESDSNISNIVYLYGGLSEVLKGTQGNLSAYNDGTRATLDIETAENYTSLIRGEIEDRIADIIAVNYKYNYFSAAVNPTGMSETARRILLAVLIAADFEDDKRYIKNKMSPCGEYAVDGIFNFRLNSMKKKWADVAAYIPKSFDAAGLKDFLAFVFEERDGKRVFIDKSKVYDGHYRLMRRTLLTPCTYGDEKLLAEVILSGGGEVELLSREKEGAEAYLREYLGDKLIFGDRYFSDKND